MTEQELLENIRQSAEKIEVPESLAPDAMRRKLKAEEENQKMGKKSRKQYYKKMAAVAAMAVVCVAGSLAAYTHWNGSEMGAEAEEEEAAVELAEIAEQYRKEPEDTDMETGEKENMENKEESAEETADLQEILPKQNAGDLYAVAKNYGEVYDLLEKYGQEQLYCKEYFVSGNMDIAREESQSFEEPVANESVAMGAESAPAESGSAKKGMMNQVSDSSADGKTYSGTNLQVEGVDESDIIKTDGSYIYTVTGSRVVITEVREEKMKAAGEIQISMNNSSDRILEMYVDGNTLNLIIQTENAKLEKSAADNKTTNVNHKFERFPTEDVYYLESDIRTEVQTYDVTERMNPIQTGSVVQDGYYKDSRKIGDMIYLFTEKTMYAPKLNRETAITEYGAKNWLPLVNERAVSADSIYIPERGNSGLLVSSVNVNKPDAVVDSTLILNDYVNIYVSQDALYLYHTDYSMSEMKTQVAKFALENGRIGAVGANAVKGEVRDTFAVNEYNGRLRMLTTNWENGTVENGLYLLDEKLELLGKLEGIAKGEEIYAARYLGNTAYFVTYRNTDPLFAVDLTDEKNPKILSELKITGFSEYLHFWGKDKLLGIGYETNPDNGEKKGLKLTMFDISNPAQLETAGSLVIGNVDASPALYNYKCVLADEKENLIGFAAQNYRNEGGSYLLFSWENGDFENRMTEKLDGESKIEDYRGIYIGERFYLAGRTGIHSYDRTKNYRLIEKYEWK